ncbi:cytochrome p450 protein [Apiospora kogelbergensis]|uniref:Cytochrome p450 protein n=1 Tax=Apiospora kogelbergensis TaxID=1337665 RepID=A0AAW0QRZ9_9PEZI
MTLFVKVTERFELHLLVTKTTGKPFTVRWWAREFLILPPRYLHALNGADCHNLSFYRTISDAFFLHTSVGDLYDSKATVEVVTKGLNPRLPRLMPIVEAELDYALDAELSGDPDGDTPTAQSFFNSIVHRITSRVLIGEELCRDERFIQLSREFVKSIFVTGLLITKLPLGPLRGWLAYPLASWHRRKLARCTTILQPMLRRRIQQDEQHRHSTKPSESRLEKLDATEWALALLPPGSEVDTQRLAQELMQNLWAGSSSPSGLATDVMFQLLLEPRYKTMIVEEARDALKHGERWTEATLNRLRLLERFIYELTPYLTRLVTCSRTVLNKPYIFPDGLTLPVGTRFGFPTMAMQNDADAGLDVLHVTDSDVGLKNATTMSAENLTFGYGTHFCPGRFFAIRLVKIVVVTLLLRYDIEWVGQITERPKPIFIEGQFIPNQTQRIRIRKRVSPGA